MAHDAAVGLVNHHLAVSAVGDGAREGHGVLAHPHPPRGEMPMYRVNG